MIEFEDVTIRYPDAEEPTLRDVSLTIPEGDLCVVLGQTGSGKTTLLRAINGLVPHFTGGTLSGRVLVDGRDTRTHRPRDLADVVGVTGQNPLATFVTDTVEEELAYGMESLGLPSDTMRARVEETLDLLGLVELRQRPLRTLSGGQQQRVAIGAVLGMHPRVLVLDEPTSALDPQAAEDVLAALYRLVNDLGTTVVLAEHRLERVIQFADRAIHVPGQGRPVEAGAPDQILATAAVAPPVVQLGRRLGWDPPPLSVRAARRLAAPVRDRLQQSVDRGAPSRATRAGSGPVPAADATSDPLARVQGLTVQYGGHGRGRPAGRPALRGLDLSVQPGELVALMGRNGAGKSTLLRSLVGLVRPTDGSARAGDLDPTRARPGELVRRVGMVPQEPGDLLYTESVAAECRQADRDMAAPSGSCAAVLGRLEPGIDPLRHPRDLSEGQRLALALAIILTGEPPLLLLDEPTRGLDYGAKDRLATILRSLAAGGHAVMFATHDVELVAELASRVVIIADGDLVADGPTRQVVLGSPVFAPQVAKILAPQPWLTTTEVATALEAAS